jgi:GMP synthase (glutamine-hydrolysing)
MKPIGILQHDRARGPGPLIACLGRRGVPYRVVHVAEGEGALRSIQDYSGLVVLGSHRSIHEPLSWIDAETALVRQCLASDTPVLGHGFGAQLLTRATGVSLTRSPGAPLGWCRFYATPPGRLWLGSSAPIDAFSWHCESFALPAGAQRLLFGDYCQNIGYVLGPHLALQCQLDITAEAVRDWALRLKTEALRRPRVVIPTEHQLLGNLEERIARLRAVLERVYLRWIDSLPGVAQSPASTALRPAGTHASSS